jgi:hypothetical protein
MSAILWLLLHIGLALTGESSSNFAESGSNVVIAGADTGESGSN